MYKHLLFIFIILFSCNISLGETVILPYTDNSNYSYITGVHTYTNISYDIIAQNNNEIYSLENYYQFGENKIKDGLYICNTSFLISTGNFTFSEKFDITNNIFSKKVNYTLITYLDNEIVSTKKNEYNAFKASAFFVTSKYSFVNEKILITNKYTSTKGSYTTKYTVIFNEKLTITDINATCNFDLFGYRKINVQYIKIGERPKEYFIEQLPSLFELPYKLIQGYDDGNLILNFLLITSYIFKVLVFWVKVIYQSLFTLFILSIIGVIPFISYTQSRTPQEFINRLGINYRTFIYLIINSVKYIINLIIKIIELIPFI